MIPISIVGVIVAVKNFVGVGVIEGVIVGVEEDKGVEVGKVVLVKVMVGVGVISRIAFPPTVLKTKKSIESPKSKSANSHPARETVSRIVLDL